MRMNNSIWTIAVDLTQQLVTHPQFPVHGKNKPNEKKDRADAEEKKRIEMQQQKDDEKLAKKLQYSLSLRESESESCLDPDFDLQREDQVHDANQKPSSRPFYSRGTSESEIPDQSSGFPQIPIRTSRKCIDEKIIRCTVQCLADHEVSREDATGIIIKTANMIFGQNWMKSADLSESDCKPELSDDEEGNELKKVTNSDNLLEIYQMFSHLIAVLTSTLRMLHTLT